MRIHSVLLALAAILTLLRLTNAPDKAVTIIPQPKISYSGEAPPPPEPLSLWYRQPAQEFTQALPLGNGRLGAMMFGGVDEERLVLNEGTLWSGGKEDADRPDAAKYLPEIRRLLLEGKNVEAEKLVYANFTCQGKGSNHARGKDEAYGSYQVLGNLKLIFPQGEARDYQRELNLDDAVARIRYAQNGVRFAREVFVSAPDEAIIIRLTTNEPGAIEFNATLDRPERFVVSADGNNGLLMRGQLNNGTDGNGMKYAARLRVLVKGGTTNVDGTVVRVTKASEALIIITAATNFQGFAGRQTANELAASARDLQKATSKTFAALLADDIVDSEKPALQQMVEVYEKYNAPVIATMQVAGEDISRFGVIEMTRQRVRPETEIDTSENCPTCGGTGEVQAPVLIIDEIENALNYLHGEKNMSGLTLKVHPFLAAYFTTGFPSMRMRWWWRWKKMVKVVGEGSHQYLQYTIEDSAGNVVPV